MNSYVHVSFSTVSCYGPQRRKHSDDHHSEHLIFTFVR